MCGIVGYLGQQNARPIVIGGLRRLEYRGYDSAGVSLFDPQRGRHRVFKEKGTIDNLEHILDVGTTHVGIGHTRWATHGRVTRENAHPHVSQEGRFIVVHNGVIDNHHALKKRYLDGLSLDGDTDTEVVANLIEAFARKLPVETALREVLKELEGSFALLVVDASDPTRMYAAKHKSPLLIGTAEDGITVGSDLMALIDVADAYLALQDGTFVRIEAQSFRVHDLEGRPLEYTLEPIEHDVIDPEKGEYEHFMLKEIHEQPAVIRRLVGEYLEGSAFRFNEALLDKLKGASRVHILAAGTSMHAGLIARTAFERIANLPAEVHIASEFAYHPPLLSDAPYFVLISQSGETADLRACLQRIQSSGHPSLTITNVPTSTLAREADDYLEIHAGPEIAVASTKAYTAQITVLLLLAHALGGRPAAVKEELAKAAHAIEGLLDDQKRMQELVKPLAEREHAFYIGRGLDYAVGLEAALKLKEISYIHTEGFAAGELKHGTLALIEEGTPVIALLTSPHIAENTRNSIAEVESRGARTLIISTREVARAEDDVILEPLDPLFAPLVSVVPTQLVAYYAALKRGHDIDKPRNLAKSVTVE